MVLKLFLPILIITLICCNNRIKEPNNGELITDKTAQETIFSYLMSLTEESIPKVQLNDSLSFLILPVKVSCPSCRKKTIDSIVKHQNDLPLNHFIIISASEGMKNIRSYFREQEQEIPQMENQLFLDSIHQAYKYGLVKGNPVIYYTVNQKAVKKILTSPATIKKDLHEFFSNSSAESRLTIN